MSATATCSVGRGGLPVAVSTSLFLATIVIIHVSGLASTSSKPVPHMHRAQPSQDASVMKQDSIASALGRKPLAAVHVPSADAAGHGAKHVVWLQSVEAVRSHVHTLTGTDPGTLADQFSNHTYVSHRIKQLYQTPHANTTFVIAGADWLGRVHVSLKNKCPVENCVIKPLHETEKPAVMAINCHTNNDTIQMVRERPGIRALVCFESPEHTMHDRSSLHQIRVDLIASYIPGSDIYNPFSGIVVPEPTPEASWPEMGRRRKDVLMVSSNCAAKERMRIVELLRSYGISVDVYGKCGNKTRISTEDFEDLLKQYKFYLAGENSRCGHYITEKYYRSLWRGLIPIAVGAPLEDYKLVVPPHSTVLVDEFDSIRQLASYIKLVLEDEALFQAYHVWRREFSLRLVDNADALYCQLCMAANEPELYRTGRYDAPLQWMEDNGGRCQPPKVWHE